MFASEGKLVASLVHAKDVTPHVPMLVVRLKDYVFPEELGGSNGGPDTMNDIHQRPQIVRIGDRKEWVGFWSLENKDLSITGGQTKDHPFTYPKNEKTDVYQSPGDDDAKWSGRELLPNVQEVAALTGGKLPATLDASKITSQVVLTQGTGSSLKPYSSCERERKYKMYATESAPEPNVERFRTYASECVVTVDNVDDYVDLLVADRGKGNGKIVRLRAKNDSWVTIANTPFGTYDTTHFEAYSTFLEFKNAKDMKKAKLAFTRPCKNQRGIRDAATEFRESDRGVERNPPDPGCLCLICERA
jgi:hypothetical protein